MRTLGLIFFVGLVCFSSVQAATIQVNGGAGLQAAIDGAGAGDRIEITDSLTYNEDIFIGPGKNGLTLIGTAVNPPTILAANTTTHSGAAPNVAAEG